MALVEVVVDAVNPKRRKETKGEKRHFIFFYCAFMFVGIAIVVWTIWSLYFDK